jgi:hypothetical protein
MSKHVTISPHEAADLLAIGEPVEAYAHCADRRDAKGQMFLFTPDTHFVVPMKTLRIGSLRRSFTRARRSLQFLQFRRQTDDRTFDVGKRAQAQNFGGAKGASHQVGIDMGQLATGGTRWPRRKAPAFPGVARAV